MENRKAEILRKVIELAAEQAGVDPAPLTAQTHFINDLHFDSLDKVEFAMEVEDEFELSVPDEEAEDLQTIGNVVDYVNDSLLRVRKDEGATVT